MRKTLLFTSLAVLSLNLAGCGEAPVQKDSGQEQQSAPTSGASQSTGQSTPAPAPTQEPTPEPAKPEKPIVTKAKFDKIKNGMKREEVEKIIGGPGEVLSESGSEGDQFHAVIIMYEGEGGFGANANFTFMNGKLENKAQIGLK
jgi:hypothetical protein